MKTLFWVYLIVLIFAASSCGRKSIEALTEEEEDVESTEDYGKIDDPEECGMQFYDGEVNCHHYWEEN